MLQCWVLLLGLRRHTDGGDGRQGWGWWGGGGGDLGDEAGSGWFLSKENKRGGSGSLRQTSVTLPYVSPLAQRAHTACPSQELPQTVLCNPSPPVSSAMHYCKYISAEVLALFKQANKIS